jgi:DNA-binding MarR family transcriptional regulator
MGRVIRATFRAMADGVEGQFDDMNLALSQWLTLKLVDDGTIDCVGDIKKELGLTTGASTRLVDQLENRGLLVRMRSGKDRRIVQVSLTQEGKSLIQALQPRLRTFWVERLVDFRTDEVDLLFSLLERLRVRLSGRPSDSGSISR